MRPITVNVGPLAAASNLQASIPVGSVNGLNVGSVPTGGSNTAGWLGTGSFAGNIFTLVTSTSGVLGAGMVLTGIGIVPAKIIGPGSTAGTWIVYPAQTVATGAVRANQVITMDAPRQLVWTNTEPPGNSMTILGTDAAGSQISETLLTNGGTLTTQQNFATVTRVTIANPTTAASSFGTAATATSAWVMFDPYASGGNISKQTVVNGAANYTVQVSYDDPNAPGGVPVGQMGWLNDTDATFVGATTSLTGSWPYVPLWARVLLNSGAGSVRATFIQPGNLGR